MLISAMQTYDLNWVNMENVFPDLYLTAAIRFDRGTKKNTIYATS